MTINNKTTFKLSSGFHIPAIGFGTSFSITSDAPDPIEVENAVKTALQIGYRHLDCAPIYKNEAAVGKGIKASCIPRKRNIQHDPKDVEPALDKSLKDLGIYYLDLYLIHWPDSWVKQDPYTFSPEDKDGNIIKNDISISATWAAMEALLMTGKVRSIGVSNFFAQEQLEELLSSSKIVPAVNQILLHPYRQNNEFLSWCASKNIHVTAWGPLTISRVRKLNVANDLALLEIAKSINISSTQLSLSWAVQRGTSVIPKSSNKERARENFEIVELPSGIMEKLAKLKVVR